MGSLNNIFSLVIGINIILIGTVAFIAGVVSFVRRDGSVKKLTSLLYLIAGAAAVCIGFVLSRDY